MKVKDEVLLCLTENMGKTVSGAEIASSLGVSRTAVWKAVNTLKSDGFNIVNKHGEGYALLESEDKVWSEGILLKMPDKHDVRITVLNEVDSTNNYLKQMANNGESEGAVVVALMQSAGKGRLGRTFVSPEKGIYFSILLRPKEQVTASMLTVLAATAVCKALQEFGINASIKWVNDIIIAEKKVCGILTEAAITAESAGIDWAIVGIGINIELPQNLPEEVRRVATDLKTHSFDKDRNTLLAAVLSKFYNMYKNFDLEEILSIYKENQIVLGRQVRVEQSGNSYIATAIDLDEKGHLIVEKEDGERLVLISGEVSLRDWEKQ